MSIISILIISCILLLNFLLYKKNYITKNLFYCSTFFIILYAIFTIVIFYDNIANGYPTGVIIGDIENAHFCDEHKYNIDSQILYDHWTGGRFKLWITGELPGYEYMDPQGHPSFGSYNIFVILLGFLRLIGFQSVVDLILIKSLIYIPTYIYLYKLSKLYINEKLSLLVVIIFSILPGYILTNSLLMRDNIVISLIIAILYYILSKKYSYKLLIPLVIILLLFRSYLILILITTIIFTFRNTKKAISKLDFIYFLLIIGTIYFFTNYDFAASYETIFFSSGQIEQLQNSFITSYGTGITMLIKLFILTIVQIATNPLFFNFLTSGIKYLFIFSVGNIVSSIASIYFGITFLAIYFKKLSNDLRYLLKFTLYFTLLTALLVMSKDSYIVNRIELMWLPLFLIISFIPFSNKNFNN